MIYAFMQILFYCAFLFFLIETNAIITQIISQEAQTVRSLKTAAFEYPSNAPKSPNIMIVIFPPFFVLFLVQIDTIPQISIINERNIPALPPASLLFSIELTKPAAQDWNDTTKNKTHEIMPEISFQFFII